MLRIAVVGAGLAGLSFAQYISPRAAVTLFEKSRGVGGRMATRYAGSFEFDHGAQFFTARSQSFRRFLAPYVAAGDVRSWNARFVEIDGGRITASRRWHEDYPHYVAAPRMNVLAKRLAATLDIRLRTPVAGVEETGAGWKLAAVDGSELGIYDWVVFTAPPAQTTALAPAGSELATLAPNYKMKACFALMLGREDGGRLEWQAARVKNSPVSWISANFSKPGRKPASAFVIHSTNAWAESHLEHDPEWVRRTLLDEACELLGADPQTLAVADLHRWRYANADGQTGPACYFDAGHKLGACGDWFIRGRVEAAYRSAADLAKRFETILTG